MSYKDNLVCVKQHAFRPVQLRRCGDVGHYAAGPPQVCCSADQASKKRVTVKQTGVATIQVTGNPGNLARAQTAALGCPHRCIHSILLLLMMDCHWIKSAHPNESSITTAMSHRSPTAMSQVNDPASSASEEPGKSSSASIYDKADACTAPLRIITRCINASRCRLRLI